MKNLQNKICIVSEQISFQELLDKLNNISNRAKYPGSALVVNKSNQLIGIITNGDIRRAIAKGKNMKTNVLEICNTTPISINENEIWSNKSFEKNINNWNRKSKKIDFIPVLDSNKKIINIITNHALIKDWDKNKDKVAIYGLGYVGITLAVHLARNGWKVEGIDSNEKLLKNLEKGNLHVFEPGLKELLLKYLKSGEIKLNHTNNSLDASVHIIAVGTPVNLKGEPNLEAVEKVTSLISKNLKEGDLVTLRSTVPVETSRNKISKIIEKQSKLKIGLEIFLAFTPERTVEGAALKELSKLPQIVGGLTDNCCKVAAEFFSQISSSILKTDNIEAAELIKLVNNSYRDLNFAFSNELGILATQYNLNTFKLIDAANIGYERNNIPYPSPGVGGYCLTKDPLIYSNAIKNKLNRNSLSVFGREINSEAINLPINSLKNYCKKFNFKFSDLAIFIVGITFKGIPETKDCRSSTSLSILKILHEYNKGIFGLDYMLNDFEIEQLGFSLPNKFSENSKNKAFLVINNHPQNINLIRENIKNEISDSIFVFDGWNLLADSDIRYFEKVRYSSIGYSEF